MMTHLACVMDGNRRWAIQQGFSVVGRAGIDAAYRAVEFCIAQKIPILSLFAFSLENFKRSTHEVNPLFDLMAAEMLAKKDELIKQNIKIQFVGDRLKFPYSIQEPCQMLERATALGTTLQVNIMICYGAQQEIVDATLRIIQDVEKGIMQKNDLTPATFTRYLWTKDMPPPDLIIRTGGVHRLSNFLLYLAAYSELYFLDCLWPALSEADLMQACDYFKHCKRNFGV